ncbi:MAG: hypothetical protein ACRC1N_07260 [Aeromonas sobria]
MNDVNLLFHLSKLLESAIMAQDLQLAHELADKRLALLDKVWNLDTYSFDLVNAASVILTNEPRLTGIILDEQNEIKKKLLAVIASDKASQLYKSHSKEVG